MDAKHRKVSGNIREMNTFAKAQSIQMNTTCVERNRVTNILLIIGIGALAVILIAVLLFVAGAILTAWTYAKSPQAHMAEELEDNGTIEG